MGSIQHQLAPSRQKPKFATVVALLRRQAFTQAMEQLNVLLEEEPENLKCRIVKGIVLVRLGDAAAALEIFESVLKDHPRQGLALLSYGHTLKSVGRANEAPRAYRRVANMRAGSGEAYWSLANLKTFKLSDSDIEAMRAAINSENGDAGNQSHLAFALAKALEDTEQYDESFKFYQRGNAIRRLGHRFDSKRNMVNTARQVHTCTAEFFATRHGQGCPARDPIFIVGLPRSGSTLLEQILASHSLVEGTAELPDIIAISRQLGGR